MKIEKRKINGYDTYIHKTNKYTSIHLRFLFEMPYTKENIYKYDLLESYQIHANQKYKTRKKMSERKMELYAPTHGFGNYYRGEKMFVEASFSFYDPELIGDDYLKEAFEFVRDLLYFPNFEGGHLEQQELARCKANMVAQIEDELMNFRNRAQQSFTEHLYPGSYKLIDRISSKKEIEDLLNSFSDQDLIDAHRDLLDNRLVGAIIMGNIKEEYLKWIEELFKFEHVASMDRDFKEVIPVDPNIKDFVHIVDRDYKESVVNAVYTYETKSLKEKMAYRAIVNMLGSSGMLMHKTLRDEQGIVYTASASYSKTLDIFIMSAIIDAKNLDKALEGFDMVLKKLDKKTIEELLVKIKEEVDLAVYVFDESKWNVFFEFYDVAFGLNEPKEMREEAIKSLTVEDIEVALSKMKRVTVHFYEGAKK